MTTQAKSENSFTQAEKMQVVKWFAEFYTPQQVSNLVLEHFGKHRERYTFKHYLQAPTWRQLFEEHREKFLNDISAIPYANKAVRIERLNRLADRLIDAVEIEKTLKNGTKKKTLQLFVIDRLLATLKQIAEEVGDIQSKTEVNVYQLIAQKATERGIDLSSLSEPSIKFEVSRN